MSFSQVFDIYERKYKDLSEVLGVTEKTIYNWLKENKLPSKKLEQVAKYFRLDKEYFIRDLSYLECLQLRLKYCDLIKKATIQELEAEQMKVGASNG